MKVAVGGLRAGDSFRAASKLRAHFGLSPLELICGTYTVDLWKAVIAYTDLNAKVIGVVEDGLPIDFNSYIRFCDQAGVRNHSVITLNDLSVTWRYPGRIGPFERVVSGEYIVVHPGSISW